MLITETFNQKYTLEYIRCSTILTLHICVQQMESDSKILLMHIRKTALTKINLEKVSMEEMIIRKLKYCSSAH